MEKQTLKQARIVVASEGKKSLIGKDWLAKLNFQVAESNKNSEYNNNIINNINSKTNNTEKSTELNRKENKFPNIFKKQGNIVGHTIQIEFKEGAKVPQQNGRRVPLQLKKSSG